MSSTTDLRLTFQTVLVEDELKQRSVPSKITYINDVVGQLFGAVARLEAECGALHSALDLALHSHYLLTYLTTEQRRQGRMNIDQPDGGRSFLAEIEAHETTLTRALQQSFHSKTLLEAFQARLVQARGEHSSAGVYKPYEASSFATCSSDRAALLADLESKYQTRRINQYIGHFSDNDDGDDDTRKPRKQASLEEEDDDDDEEEYLSNKKKKKKRAIKPRKQASFEEDSEEDDSDEDIIEDEDEEEVVDVGEDDYEDEETELDEPNSLPFDLSNQAENSKDQRSNSTPCITIPDSAPSDPLSKDMNLVIVDFHSFQAPDLSLYMDRWVSKTRGEKDVLYACKVPNCTYITGRRVMISVHLYKHFNLKPFHCYQCTYKTDLKKNVARHMIAHRFKEHELYQFIESFAIYTDPDKGDLYRCRFVRSCQFETNHTAVLIDHLNWHLSLSPYRCAYCSSSFGDRFRALRHVNASHKRQRAVARDLHERSCPEPGCGFRLEQPNVEKMVEHFRLVHTFNAKVKLKAPSLPVSRLVQYSRTTVPHSHSSLRAHLKRIKPNPYTPPEEPVAFVKRKRGRPRKNLPVPSVKRGKRGRPRKEHAAKPPPKARRVMVKMVKKMTKDDSDYDDDGSRLDQSLMIDEDAEVVHGDGGGDGVGFTVRYSCSYKNCRYRSQSQTQVKAHEVRRHKRKWLRCPQPDCEVLCRTKMELKRHLIDGHDIADFRCEMPQCTRGFVSNAQMKQHVRVDHADEYQTCPHCQKQFRARHYMMRHVRLWHHEGEFTCSECDYTGKYRIEIERHMVRKHSKTKACPVDGCTAILALPVYSNHVKRHMNIKQHQCSWPDCGKEFVDRKSLKDHVRIHLNFKRFKCKWPECGYGSEQRTNVVKHIRIRHFKLPYTKKEAMERNISIDHLPQKPADFVESLKEDIQL